MDTVSFDYIYRDRDHMFAVCNTHTDCIVVWGDKYEHARSRYHFKVTDVDLVMHGQIENENLHVKEVS